MYLSDFFDQLTYGEFSQLSLSGAENEGILSEHWPAAVSHIQLGLTELYKRFPIRLKEVQIQQYTAISSYRLEENYTVSTGSAGTLYIMDAADPFTNTVLRIEKVYDDTNAEYFDLNDDGNELSLHTTAFDTIKVPTPVEGNTMTVTYRSNHDKIVIAGLVPETTMLEIPDSLIEALLYYVASRAHTSLPTLDTGVNEGNVYLAKFEASIAKITELSLLTNVNRTNNRIGNNGWA